MGRAGARGWERPEEAALWKAAPEKAGVQQSVQLSGHGPAPPNTSNNIHPCCNVWKSEAQGSRQLVQGSRRLSYGGPRMGTLVS